MTDFPAKLSLSRSEKVLNFITFPFRAVVQNPNRSTAMLMCLRDERMYYVARHCRGRVLDIGCGPYNIFCRQYLKGDAVGVDFFQYPGLTKDQIIDPPLPLPFANSAFDTVTLIANVNHIPLSIVKDEFAEIGRVLAPGGRLVVTRIGPIVSFMTHNLVHLQSKISSSYYDMDNERGVEEDERLSVGRKEIDGLALSAGLHLSKSEKIWTQWSLNQILVYEKMS